MLNIVTESQLCKEFVSLMKEIDQCFLAAKCHIMGGISNFLPMYKTPAIYCLCLQLITKSIAKSNGSRWWYGSPTKWPHLFLVPLSTFSENFIKICQ